MDAVSIRIRSWSLEREWESVAGYQYLGGTYMSLGGEGWTLQTMPSEDQMKYLWWMLEDGSVTGRATVHLRGLGMPIVDLVVLDSGSVEYMHLEAVPCYRYDYVTPWRLSDL